MENINICENCTFWDKLPNQQRGVCKRFEYTSESQSLEDKGFDVESNSIEDVESHVEVVTGCNFGCNLFVMDNRFYSPLKS